MDERDEVAEAHAVDDGVAAGARAQDQVLGAYGVTGADVGFGVDAVQPNSVQGVEGGGGDEAVRR